uniref:ABC transporter ATP-binding protein n=1 Tax=Streptomyces auratus AGR0001 TaxID=1160718 RepID=J1ZM71_9ACTN
MTPTTSAADTAPKTYAWEIRGSGLRVRVGRKKMAVDGLDLSLGIGAHGLLGPNGAGKTTLIRTLATVLRPTEGELELLGASVGGMVDHRALRRRIGYLPQDFGYYKRFTVREFVEYMAWLKEVPKADVPAAVQRAVERVGLADRADHRMKTLSGGMVPSRRPAWTRRSDCASASCSRNWAATPVWSSPPTWSRTSRPPAPTWCSSPTAASSSRARRRTWPRRAAPSTRATAPWSAATRRCSTTPVSREAPGERTCPTHRTEALHRPLARHRGPGRQPGDLLSDRRVLVEGHRGVDGPVDLHGIVDPVPADLLVAARGGHGSGVRAARIPLADGRTADDHATAGLAPCGAAGRCDGARAGVGLRPPGRRGRSSGGPRCHHLHAPRLAADLARGGAGPRRSGRVRHGRRAGPALRAHPAGPGRVLPHADGLSSTAAR